MYLRWEKKPLAGRDQDPDCPHEGPGRYSMTPTVWRTLGSGPTVKQQFLFRPAGAIKSCCIRDPIVRVRWWEALRNHKVSLPAASRGASGPAFRFS
jgi:hypothetical protein